MIPGTTILSEDLIAQRLQLMQNYQEVANIANGRLGLWTPAVYGATTAGSPTHTTQKGWYFVQGIMVDVWCDVVWSNVGGAVGDITMNLPVESSRSDTNIWNGYVFTNSLSQTANYTYTGFIITQNTNVATLHEFGAGQAAATLTFATAGTGGFFAHFRYIMKRDLSRR